MTLTIWTALILAISSFATAQDPGLISRTEYTYRVEIFSQYQRLHAGKQSSFRIELKDVADDTAIEAATVTLTVRASRGTETITQTTARAGKAKGEYLADLTIPRAGLYAIEYRIKTLKLNERLLVDQFEVEP